MIEAQVIQGLHKPTGKPVRAMGMACTNPVHAIRKPRCQCACGCNATLASHEREFYERNPNTRPYGYCGKCYMEMTK